MKDSTALRIICCPDCDGQGVTVDRHPHDPDAVESECESCNGLGDWYCCPRCDDYLAQDAELSALHVDQVRRRFGRALKAGDDAMADRCRNWLTDFERTEATGQCAACDRADQAEEDERAELDAISMAAELAADGHSCNCGVCGRGIWREMPRVEFGAAALCLPCAEGASAALTLAAVKAVAA